jgi:DNA invertase Pin-like site-specific DNA recombinase
MRVAIYARYSSESQSEKSIDDQIRVCKKYIQEHNMAVISIFILMKRFLVLSLTGRAYKL